MFNVLFCCYNILIPEFINNFQYFNSKLFVLNKILLYIDAS